MPRPKNSSITKQPVAFKPTRHALKAVMQAVKDGRFPDSSKAMRHFLSIGIQADSAANFSETLAGKIIKTTQKDVVRDELRPLTKSFNSLTENVESYKDNVDENFASTNSLVQLTGQNLSQDIEMLKAVLEKYHVETTETLAKIEATGNLQLKIQVLTRALFYIFLIGVNPMKAAIPDKLDPISWNKFISSSTELLNACIPSDLDLTDFDQIEPLIKQASTKIFQDLVTSISRK